MRCQKTEVPRWGPPDGGQELVLTAPRLCSLSPGLAHRRSRTSLPVIWKGRTVCGQIWKALMTCRFFQVFVTLASFFYCRLYGREPTIMHTKYTDASTAVTVGPGLWCMSYSSGVWGKKKKKFKSYAAFTTKELCFSEGKAYLRFYFLKCEFCV